MTRHRRVATAAWVVGAGGAVACTATVLIALALGLYSVHLLFYATFIAAGILGALIGARQPRNSVGWLMSIASLAAVLYFLPVDYGYAALVIAHGSWPFGREALWFGAWAWAPLLGAFLPSLTVRFPDRRVPRRWRAVDWLAIGGTVTFAAGIALAPEHVSARFVQVPDEVHRALGSAFVANPLPTPLPAAGSEAVIAAGVGLMLLAYLFAVLSVIDRYRLASGDGRLQLKWFVYAGVIVVGCEIAGGIALIAGRDLGADADAVIHLAPFALPVAIAIAILYHRLYEIDLLINRTLVYGGLTAILAATYTAGITFLQRVFVAVSGQRSDAVYVITAFAIVVGFTPVKSWVQGWVDLHVGKQGSAAAMNEFSAEIDSVVSVLDADRTARRLVDEAMAAYGAAGAAIFVGPYATSNGRTMPTYGRGSVKDACVEVPVRCDGRQLGTLRLGGRRGGGAYSRRDRDALQRSADSVGAALALAEQLWVHDRGAIAQRPQSKD